MQLKLLVFVIACLFCFWTVGCEKSDGAGGKFEPPKTSYQEAFFALSDGPMEMRVKGASVTSDFFAAKAEPPLLGRVFTKTEFDRDSGRVVVINRALWTGHFRSDPKVIGHVVTINGADDTIIGIMPDTTNVPLGAELWVPKM